MAHPKPNFTFDVIENIGTLSVNPNTNWSRQLRRISWNGSAIKYDIRDWTKDESGEERMSRGVTLTTEECMRLKKLLNEHFS